MNLVGDYENGKVYHYDLDTYTDAGDYIPAVWTYRHLDAQGRMVFYHRVEIEMENGIGIQTGQGSDPQIELRWSNDHGRTWSPFYARDMGPIGKYRSRARWNSLGSSDDRVYQARITDPVRRAIANANIEATMGRS